MRHTMLGGLAGLAAFGCAAADLRVSGLLDMAVYRDGTGTVQIGTVRRNVLAFSGREALAPGLAVVFKLSQRFELDTGQVENGSKPLWQDETTLGLVRAGRALTPLWQNDWRFDPWDNFDRIASPAWRYWHYYLPSDRTTPGGGEYGRLDDGLFYDSPALRGFSLHLGGSLQTPEPGERHPAGLTIRWTGEATQAMASVERNGQGDRGAFAGGRLQLGAWALMAAWDRSERSGPTGDTAEVLTLGAVYSRGALSLKAGAGRLAVDSGRRQFVGLGAEHALSARTAAYLSAGREYGDTAANDVAAGVGLAHRF